MDQADLKNRTKAFALRIMKLVEAVPASTAGTTVGRQIIRSGTSVGANYRAACRARSRAEFAAKIGVVIEVADETAFWLEMIVGSGLLPESRVHDLAREADELTAILVATAKQLKS
jgi:four helix bundle protein